MNLKVYEKTRYQNIYRHKKNKNYVIMISKPVKSSIATINNEKILKLEEALKIRDNPKIKMQKSFEVNVKTNFDELFERYIYVCKYEKKLSYSTYNKKEKLYKKYLKGNFKKAISKITKDMIIELIDSMETTDKQKNETLKLLRAFFNWCVDEECILTNPTNKINLYKVTNSEMKYWNPNELKSFLDLLNENINNNVDKKVAYRIKALTLIGFTLGDRIGETRALTFKSVNKNKSTISIKHSINYDPNDPDYLSTTKTYASQRNVDVSNKIVEEIEKYKYYLINELGYNVTDDTLIFYNHKRNRPFSDTTLRKQFYKYCDMAEVPRIRMYDLRHTYVATMMAEGKELYLISERLGHVDYSTTVNKYGHLSNKIRKEIAEVTDKFL